MSTCEKTDAMQSLISTVTNLKDRTKTNHFLSKHADVHFMICMLMNMVSIALVPQHNPRTRW